jgi:hypothetical protein
MKYPICIVNLLLACAANASSQPQTPEEFVFAELAICIQSGGCAILWALPRERFTFHAKDGRNTTKD